MERERTPSDMMSTDETNEQRRRLPPTAWAALSPAEQAERYRMELYMWHKNSGTLGTYYQMYPLDAPPTRKPRENDERER